MEKRIKKLAVLGVFSFAIILLLVLFFTGFFAGERAINYLDNLPSKKQSFTISNSSFDTKEITIQKGNGTGVGVLAVFNEDEVIHRVLALCKNPEAEEYRVVGKLYVKPNQQSEAKALIDSDNFSSAECLLSCPTCDGEITQVKVTIE